MPLSLFLSLPDLGEKLLKSCRFPVILKQYITGNEIIQVINFLSFKSCLTIHVRVNKTILIEHLDLHLCVKSRMQGS